MTEDLYNFKLRFPEYLNENISKMTLGDLTINLSNRNKENRQYKQYSVTNTQGFVPQEDIFVDRQDSDKDLRQYKMLCGGEFAYNPARINVGSIARYDGTEECLISSLYVCFKQKDIVDSDWLLYFLKSKRALFYYNLYGEGGVRIYLFYPNFARIHVRVPILEEQRKIASTIESITAKLDQEIILLSSYQKQRKYLLQKMFI